MHMDRNGNSTLVNKMNKVGLVLCAAILVAAFTQAQEHQPAPSPTNAAAHEPVAAGTVKDAEAAARGEHEPDAAHAAEGEHSVWAGLLWPTVNFVILAGGLWYFFREPVSGYLRDRHQAIRRDLVEAAQMKATAAAHLAEIDRKLKALPGEIEALKRRGAEEIAAEEQRIAQAATVERERLLEQTRREIELQVRLAKRELVEHAATLAVQIAGERITETITPADQDRLVDRYLDGMKEAGR
jgi:F0F1-type ATP synthase membrane subunit b/b'